MSGENYMPGMTYRYYPIHMYYPENAYPNALRLIVEAVQGEREDELFYDYLLRNAPDDRQRQIIASIRDDERKHNRMFRELYFQLTGQDVPPAPDGAFEIPGSYLEGIERALFGELNAVVRYRQILFGLVFLPFRNLLIEIITDEIRHADMWNFLYTLNVTGESGPPPSPVTELSL